MIVQNQKERKRENQAHNIKKKSFINETKVNQGENRNNYNWYNYKKRIEQK